MSSLNALAQEAFMSAVAKGFTDNTVGEDIALMHSELSEALEDYRKGIALTEVYYEGSTVLVDGVWVNNQKPCGIPIELADCMIRILHFCGRHGIDIEAAIREKMLFNAARPFKHGGKNI